eukprot:scaffold52625_cov74-Cyclotella_meneghiniana.AAC.9
MHLSLTHYLYSSDDWFTSRGVQLKTESDGRMFPITDNSQTIIDVISTAAIKAGVCLRIKEKVNNVKLIRTFDDEPPTFALELSLKAESNGRITNEEMFDSVILSTGSFPAGYSIARSLGHNIITPVPSLFTFDSKELTKEGGIFNGLSGLSVPLVRISLILTDDMQAHNEQQEHQEQKDGKKKKGIGKRNKSIIQEGPLLIT